MLITKLTGLKTFINVTLPGFYKMKLSSNNLKMSLLQQWYFSKKGYKIIGRYLLVISMLILFSCNNTSSDKETLLKLLVNMDCRAIELKNKRFQLADNIRYAQDTLLHFKSITDTALIQIRLKDWDFQKQLIVNHSLALADSIKLQMEILMPRYFNNKKKEMEFNMLLDEALKKNGCK